MADVFISYARADRTKIQKLAAALEAHGLTVWWDREILGGAEFAKDIERELNGARVAIVAWSAQSNESPWVRDEASRAQRQGKLVPVRLDQAEAPIGFGQFQVIDLSRWRGDRKAAAFTDLMRALGPRLSGAAPAARVEPERAWITRLLRPAPLVIAAVVLASGILALTLRSPGDREAANTAAPVPAQPESAGIADKSPTPELEIDPASIAVLPFADLSPEGDQQYFSDGITEEILNVLSKVEGLKVASRTSSFRFRQAEAGAPAIAKDLRVRHLLEGSVRKAGDTVRITAQLIDAESDRHLWSEVYDRPLTAENAFAIQEDIAGSVVRELSAKIGDGADPSASVSIQADAANFEAYELYLKGRSLFAQRGANNLEAAARDLEKATALDPGFARAWETLAMVYGVSESWDLTHRDYQRLALDAADRAERLNPALATPYAVRGTVLFDMIGTGESDDWAASIANLDEAIARDPRSATVWLWRGIDFLALGYFDRAITDIAQCLELDPAYGYCYKWLAFTYLVAGLEDKALLFYERGKGVAFSSDAVFAAVYADRGDYPAARATLVERYPGMPELVSALFRSLTDPSFGDAERAEALALIENAPSPVVGQTAARFLLGDYSDVPNNINSGLWWYGGDARYSRSAERKEHMRRFHLPDYWRANGFPEQCRPLGADDFECD